MDRVSLYFLQTKQVERCLSAIRSALSEEDLAGAERFRERADYLRALASCYLKNKYSGAGEMQYTPRGKPFKPGAHFNLSHSGGVAVIGVSGCEIGIDIEEEKPRGERLINGVISETERDHIRSAEDFFAVWTLKESLLKCIGCGLVNPMREVPAFPEGVKLYRDERFFCKSFRFEGYALAVTLKTEKENFEFCLTEERLEDRPC